MRSVIVSTSRTEMMRIWPALATIFGTRGVYRVTATRLDGRRTRQQNRLYWACVEILAHELGFESRESCHAMLMEEAGFGRHVQIRDRTYFARRSSAELTKSEFSALINTCKKIAAFLNEDRPPEAWVILPVDEVSRD